MSSSRIQDDDETVQAQVVTSHGAAAAPAREASGTSKKTRFSAGDVLSERFVIIRFLGSGGMGEVYEVQDRLLQNADLAIKTLPIELAYSAEAKDRLEREVLLARKITHPNVCPLYQIEHHQGAEGICLFLSMKLVPGETLAARLERGETFTPEEAGMVARQIAGALQAAHGLQIIHRDIKPSNIMLEGHGADIKAVVMDFGLARTFDSDVTVTGSASLLGTPAYMAPELFKGQIANEASDLYAFGLVLHQIYWGRRPDGAPGSLRIGQATHSNRIPAFVPVLISRLVSNDTQARQQAFQEALVRLHVEGSKTRATAVPKAALSRRRWLILAAAGGCALGGTAVLEWDEVEALLKPLPRKRFVALMNWPPPAINDQFAPMLSGVLDALEQELSRAEAFDHDLYVTSSHAIARNDDQLSKISGSLGANLVLASSARLANERIELFLKILDASAERVLRQSVIHCGLDEIPELPGKAVQVAAHFLGVGQFVQPSNRLQMGTVSMDAYRAFQAGEHFRFQPNDEGLDPAIEQYKLAIEKDSRYAMAHARLGWMYGRLFWVRHDPAALDLAQANAATALHLDAHLVAAHQVMGNLWFMRGDNKSALSEMEKALALDPADASSILFTGQVYFQMNQFARAEDMFRKVLVSRPNDWLTYYYLGNICRAQGKYQEAFRAFAAGRLTSPKNTFLLNSLGETALKLGQVKDSLEAFEKSYSIRPSGVGAADLAQTLRSEGKNTEALAYAQKAVSFDAKDDELWRELGDCFSVLPKHEADARNAYTRAAENAKAHLQINDSEGLRWILLSLYEAKLDHFAAARTAMKQAERFGAADLDSQLTKARTLELVGERQQAIQQLANCFRNGATKFEIGTIPDLASLRADSRYLTVFQPK